jgi:hypothetical protein
MLKQQYVTAGELAERMGVAPTHLYWLARCGKIPPGERLGRERIYSQDQAETDPLKPTSQPGRSLGQAVRPRPADTGHRGIVRRPADGRYFLPAQRFSSMFGFRTRNGCRGATSCTTTDLSCLPRIRSTGG